MNTLITSSGIQDGSGSPLTGMWCLGSVCFLVTDGAIAPNSLVPNPSIGFGVTVLKGSQIVLSVPNVSISGTMFDWDDYVVPPGVETSGIGTPYLASAPGATYTNTAGESYSGNSLGGWVLNESVQSLTTSGSSGASTLADGVLNVPEYSGGGGGATTLVQVPVTATQLALMTDAGVAPVTLVAAPASGKAIYVIQLIVEYVKGSIAFTDIGGTFDIFPAGSPTDGYGVDATIATLTGNQSSVNFISGGAIGPLSDFASELNGAALVFGTSSGAGPILGNGSLILSVVYTTINVS